MNDQRISRYIRKSTTKATYLMSSSFRILDNHALYYAVNNFESFNIMILQKKENDRQDAYFSSFVDDLVIKLKQFGSVSILSDYHDIFIDNEVILDKSYLREDLEIENFILEKSKYSVTIVESNVVVPVSVTSNKEEYSARTIRPKIHKNLISFIDPVLEEYHYSNIEKEAIVHLENFIHDKLQYYHLKNHPEYDYTSNISVYLKFGIVSPVRILLMLEPIDSSNKESFIEELIVRRELSFNFIFYNRNYDDFHHMTYSWAYQTMEVHKFDLKEYIYNVEDYINFNTHDKFFNAAMKEMVLLGKMHGYMRMYWCKKIIEWSPSFKAAYETAIYLNNTYFLDGNTPNGYTGVAWCFGKHDRAWNEREIFGKLRYMNANGLKRKFDIDQYIVRIEKEVVTNEISQTPNSD